MACTHAQYLPGTSWSPGSAAVTCCQTAAIKTELAVLVHLNAVLLRCGEAHHALRFAESGKVGLAARATSNQHVKSLENRTPLRLCFPNHQLHPPERHRHPHRRPRPQQFANFFVPYVTRDRWVFPLSPASIGNSAVPQRTGAPLGHPRCLQCKEDNQAIQHCLLPPCLCPAHERCHAARLP